MKREEDEDKDINYDPMMPHMYGGGILDSTPSASDDAASLLSTDGNGAPFMQGAAENALAQPDMSQAMNGKMTNRDAGKILYGSWGGYKPPFSAPESAGHVATESQSIQKTALPDASAPQAGLPGIPQDSTQDALNQLLAGQKAGMEKYGPEQQMAVQNALIQGRNGLGPSLARAGGGLADAIMQGVARAGPSNFQKNITDQQNQMATEQMGTMKDANTQKMSQMQAEMKLSMDDPTSPLSRVAQNSERNTLKKIGWSDDEIGKASASMIGEATKNGLSYADVQAKLKLEGTIHEETIGMQRQALGLKEKENAQNHWFQNMLPDGKPNSGAFDHGSIPSGTVYKAPDGTMRRKK